MNLNTIVEEWKERLNQELKRTVDEDEVEQINQALAIILTIDGLLQRTNYDFPTFSSGELKEIRSLIEQAQKDTTKLEKLARTLRVSIDVASTMVELAAKYGKYLV